VTGSQDPPRGGRAPYGVHHVREGCSNRLWSARRLAYSLRICRAFFSENKKRISAIRVGTGPPRMPPRSSKLSHGSDYSNVRQDRAYRHSEPKNLSAFGGMLLSFRCLPKTATMTIPAVRPILKVRGSRVCVHIRIYLRFSSIRCCSSCVSFLDSFLLIVKAARNCGKDSLKYVW
jgi:hypothetical protein